MARLHPKWTSHLSSESTKKEFATSVQYSVVLDRLREILKERMADINRSEINCDYTSPSWAYAQAHHNGLRQGLRMLDDLLTRGKNDQTT